MTPDEQQQLERFKATAPRDKPAPLPQKKRKIVLPSPKHIIANVIATVIILSSLNSSDGQLSNWTAPPWYAQLAVVVIPLSILNYIFRSRPPVSPWHLETRPDGEQVWVRDPDPQIGFFFWW